MRIGTRSLLYGIHAIWLHPFFVFAGWWQLYGFPWDPRLWVAFLVHDWGYWGKENMDGPEGELHPRLGAKIMRFLFDHHVTFVRWNSRWRLVTWTGRKWHDFTLYHSRYMAKQEGTQPSLLCYADKMAICTMPIWLYVPLATLSGELREYMDRTKAGREGAKYADMQAYNDDPRLWCMGVRKYITGWVNENNPLQPKPHGVIQ